jgi:hypothetical protein
MIEQQRDTMAGFTKSKSLLALLSRVKAIKVEVLPPHKNGVTGKALNNQSSKSLKYVLSLVNSM